MLAYNIVMTVVNVLVLIALVVWAIVAVYNNKPNFELTPRQRYAQNSGQKFGIGVVVAVVVSWLASIPGIYDGLSMGSQLTYWWIELVANICAIVFACISTYYYSELNKGGNGNPDQE